jgi:hypothetical protein
MVGTSFTSPEVNCRISGHEKQGMAHMVAITYQATQMNISLLA